MRAGLYRTAHRPNQIGRPKNIVLLQCGIARSVRGVKPGRSRGRDLTAGHPLPR
jgi:hypothetical protein